MKKELKIALLSVLGLVVVSAVFLWVTFGPLVKGALSVEKLDEGLYYMEYKGDDGFNELMKLGGSENISQLSPYIAKFLSRGFSNTAEINPPIMPVGCSTLTVNTPERGVMMARNFDYPYGTGLILHTIPNAGYESVTTFSVDFFGFGEGYIPEGFTNQYMALAGLFLALDGFNEKGLAIAVLEAGDEEETNQQTFKPDLTTTSATQFLLKNAANVSEAIELLKSIDMHSDPGAAYHLAIADASGRSVVVEYVGNEMIVTDTPFVTNHYLCKEKYEFGLDETDHRHEKIMEQYNEAGGVMNGQQLMETIMSVAQEPKDPNAVVGGTLWTMVMDLTNPSVTYYSRRHFNNPFFFKLSKTK
ncbi:MAG: linear amide C-N hydrolase [Bacteroidaceae bacterium]|nr:linear amide C-N hydrolase [Bacteroidaceae bacterium]